nr:retrovirus-related Pol polyprotein from transposon TNT 1-94 [Tanacetum cinerariifolium]
METVEVSQTLEYRGGQLNAARVLEVENFTNWKKRFMCHIIGIEPQFKNIIKNDPFAPMTAGQRKTENQWTGDERKTADLDQRFKSLIMSVLLDDQMNYVINGLTTKSTWDDLILYHEGPSDVKESRVMDLKLCYNTFKFKEDESLTQTFTRYKALMNELDFQDSLDDEEDIRSSHESLNDLEEEYQARALLAKSKRFFKKGTQRFNTAKATDQTECHKCGKKGHFVRDCWLKTLVSTYQSPFQPKPLSSSHHKPELRPTNDFEAKYNKVKAKLALLSSSSSASKASMIKNKGLIAEAYEWDEEKVSSDDNEMVEVKVLMALAEENDAVSKVGARNGEWVKISMRKHVNIEILKENKNLRTELKELKAITETWINSSNKVNQCISEQIPSQKKRILGVDQLTKDPSCSGLKDIVFVKSSADDTKVTIPCVKRPWLSEAEGFILLNHNTDESSICIISLPPLKKLDGAELIFGSKTIKSILRTCDHAEYISTKNMSQHLKSLGRMSSRPNILRPSKRFFPSRIHCDERKINPRNHQHAFKKCKACGSPNHTTTDQYDIEWFKRREALQAKKAEALKSTRAESSNANRSNTPTKRHMTGVKSYMHKYMEQPGPKVVFGDDSTCTTEGYGSIKCNGIVFTKFDEKRETIFNSYKEIVMIAPRTSSIKKCLYLLHMDLFGPVTPRSINHEKYTFVIVDEYSRYTRVYFLKKKSQAPETIMSFIKRVENQNDIKVKQLRTDNVYIQNHKDHLGKFDEKANDGYLLGYSRVSKAFRVFSTKRQQTKETHHITFDESLEAIKFSNPQLTTSTLLNQNDIHLMNIFILMNLLKDQNDQPVQNDELLNDDHFEHSNHTNDE